MRNKYKIFKIVDYTIPSYTYYVGKKTFFGYKKFGEIIGFLIKYRVFKTKLEAQEYIDELIKLENK